MKNIFSILLAASFIVGIFLFGKKDKPQQHSVVTSSETNILPEFSEVASENSNAKLAPKERQQKIIDTGTGAFETRIMNIAEAEKAIARDDVIAKLNGDDTDPTDRGTLFRQLKEIDQLRIKQIEDELAAINDEFAQLVVGQDKRLVSFGVKQP